MLMCKACDGWYLDKSYSHIFLFAQQSLSVFFYLKKLSLRKTPKKNSSNANVHVLALNKKFSRKVKIKIISFEV